MNNWFKICSSKYERNNNSNEIFWYCIKLYIEKPHCVQRHLVGADNVYNFKANIDMEFIQTNLDVIKECWNIGCQFHESEHKNLMQCFIHLGASVEEISKTNVYTTLNQINPIEDRCATVVILNRKIPKNVSILPYHELTILNVNESSCNCIFMLLDKLESDSTSLYKVPDFLIKFSQDDISIFTGNVAEIKGNQWLSDKLFSKLNNWLHNVRITEESQTSLNLINLEDYNKLYNELKLKYGVKMVQLWPERTNPEKYVYEDIGIATYLILLWKMQQNEYTTTTKQSFIDLGCGNGLLVYILSSEGYIGSGIDIRKRGIWDMYPDSTILKEETIIPSNNFIFPKTDWIIGNHSDELSPWIPVIAARSSYSTNYFLLPCCAYEFNGQKYQRKNSQKSQYNDFLEYVKEISSVCGFNTIVDRLKIPSTKRVCIIGYGRTYPLSKYKEYDTIISNFINQRTCTSASGDPTGWNTDFKQRNAVEIVRNCTQIDKTIQDKIVRAVFLQIVAKERYVSDFINPKWNFGQKITLSEVSKQISGDILKSLKSECGGLQTLLRNHHNIFEVRNGCVQLRTPTSYAEKLHNIKNSNNIKNLSVRKKECWFLANHPNGCPFSAAECSFKH